MSHFYFYHSHRSCLFLLLADAIFSLQASCEKMTAADVNEKVSHACGGVVKRCDDRSSADNQKKEQPQTQKNKKNTFSIIYY
jgi:hypothetical protein